MRVRNLLLALCFLWAIGAVQQGPSTRPPIPLTVLSSDIVPVKEAFNRDENRTRALLLLSPT
jgi:hypothetical protein